MIANSNYVFDLIFYKKLFDLIDDLYNNINIINAMEIEIKINYNFIYELADLKPRDINTNNLLMNPNTNHSVNFELKRNKQRLKKTLQREIEDAIKHNKSLDDINKKIKSKVYKKVYGKTKGDGAKTLRIFRTEYTRARTQAQLLAINELEKEGYKISRIWVHSFESVIPRTAHLSADGMIDNDGYFMINGHQTRGPGLFGIASEDINCRCYTECYVRPYDI